MIRTITPFVARKIFLLKAYGLSNQQVAVVLGISVSAIASAQENPDFLASMQSAKEKADLAVVNSLYARAIGYDYEEEVVVKLRDGENNDRFEKVLVKKHLPPDVRACMFWLACRDKANWSMAAMNSDPANPNSGAGDVHYHYTVIQKLHETAKTASNRVAPLLGAPLGNGAIHANGAAEDHRSEDGFRVD